MPLEHERRRCVAIDPGRSSGVAFYDPQDAAHPIRTYTKTPAALMAWANLGLWGARTALWDLILIERAPIQGAAETLSLQRAVWETLLEYHNPALVLVSPGEWKPWVKVHPLPEDWRASARDTHQRDALGMLWYWLNTH